MLPFPAGAADDDLRALVKELGAQLKQLNARVGDLENQLRQERELRHQAESRTTEPPKTVAAAQPTPPSPLNGDVRSKPESAPVTSGDIKGSFKIPGTATSLAIGGYAKLDAIYNSISSGINNFSDQILIPSSIPVGAARQGEHSNTSFTARESRLWLKSFTPTAWGELNTYLEVDFYALQAPGDERSTNSNAPRLRHAYGSLGNFLAGQTWSTFMNVGALPETSDHGGPVGQIFVRQALIRWTQPFTLAGAPMEFQAAVENPETTLTQIDGSRLTPDVDRSPDLVARLNYNPDWGSLSVAGLARQIRLSSHQRQDASSQWGGAISLAGRVKTFGQDNLRFMLNYGNALGRYISYNVFNDGAVDAAGDIRLNDVYAGFIGYQHWWNPSWRSTVVYGFAEANNPDFTPGTVSRRVQSVHVNLLWSPILQTTLGLEYIYANRELENGRSGDLQRIQFSGRYNF